MRRSTPSAARRFSTAHLTRATRVACVVLFCVGAARAPLTLGGIGVGENIAGVVRAFGTPDVVQTTDEGQFWQWTDRGGLDREVLTSDDLTVQSVLVAPAPSSTAQPEEYPVLGADAGAGDATIAASGGMSMPSVWRNIHVWAVGAGYLVEEIGSSDRVLRLRAVDAGIAKRRGYAAGPPIAFDRTAPALVKTYVPPFVPSGRGTVIVRVAVDARGHPSDVSVLFGSGDSAVDSFEVESMRWSTFKPATCAGVPCPSVYLDIGGVMR